MYFVCNFVLWRQCILLLMYYHFLERYVIYFFSKFFHSWQHWVEGFFRVSIFWREFFIFIEKLVNARWLNHWFIQILMIKSVNWNFCLIGLVHFLSCRPISILIGNYFSVEQCVFLCKLQIKTNLRRPKGCYSVVKPSCEMRKLEQLNSPEDQ